LGELSGGVLSLNIGSRASLRLYIDTNDNDETFIVRHVSGSGGSETVDVTWGNHRQQFVGVTSILVPDAGNGADVVDLRGVLVPAEVHGGIGNDTIYLSDGPGSTAYGDAGDDIITASSAATATGVKLYGGDDNDTLTGGKNAIEIHGGSGNDTITGTA